MGKSTVIHLQLKELYMSSPLILHYFEEYGIEPLSGLMTLDELLMSLSDHWLRDHGLTREAISETVASLYVEKLSDPPKFHADGIFKISVNGGFDKDKNPESYSASFFRGETVCVCGATGSGKTRFLEDIEYIANGDSPTGRVIHVNGILPTEEERELLESCLCARLSQSMNFVLELSVHDFIMMHAKCRNNDLSETDLGLMENEIMECANSLAGEKFSSEVMITELSGGQSRALMIADLAYISDAPVILIDEPENAGIDRDDILSLLSSKGKIVLVSTHDPLIALSCQKRIIIKNGGVHAILERTPEEEKILHELKIRDRELKEIRDRLRKGKSIHKIKSTEGEQPCIASGLNLPVH